MSQDFNRRQFHRLAVASLASGAVAGPLSVAPLRAAEDAMLRVRLQGDIGNLDPARIFQIENQTVAGNIYNGLVKYDDATGEIKADLAERWDIAPDAKTYTFHLRSGVTWHKGYGPFTADDVKFSFERVLDPKTTSSYRSLLEGVSVEVIDPVTVRISLDKPNARFLHKVSAYNQGWLVSRKAVAEIGHQAYALRPIGTGPFVFEKWTPGVEVRLLANPDYFGGKPKLAGIVFRVIKDETAASIALTNGEIDVFFGMQQPEVIAKLQQTAGVKVETRAASYVMNLVMNTRMKPLDNPAVRKAVAHAIDRNALITGFFKDTKLPALTALTSSFPEFTDDVPRYEFDPDKARALLKSAGTGPFEIQLAVPAVSPFDKIVIPIADNLSAVGFTPKINALERGTYLAARNKGALMTCVTGVAGPTDADNPLMALYSKGAFPPGLNTAQYDGAEDLFAKLQNENDPAQRLPIYHALQKRTMADLPTLPLYTVTVYVATGPKVQGLVQNALATLNCYSISLAA